MEKISILGVKIDNLSFQETIRTIINYVRAGKPRQIVTVNPEFIMEAQKDAEFKSILNSADLAVPDGYGLLFMSKNFLNKQFKERITGVELLLELAKTAEKQGYSIFLLGGHQGAAQKTADYLIKQFPKLHISGTYEGNPIINASRSGIDNFRQLRMTDIKPSSKDLNLSIITKVRQKKPQILFVAYGAPKQDKFISRYKKSLNVPVMVGVGGTFDYLSGKISRAPKLFRNLGLEWIWRLFMEPKRINRIISATVRFPYAVIKNMVIGKNS